MQDMQDTAATTQPATQATAPAAAPAAYLTPRQVCDLLQIGRSTLHGWLQAGEVPGAIRVGKNRIRIPQSALAALMKPIPHKSTATAPNILLDAAAA